MDVKDRLVGTRVEIARKRYSPEEIIGRLREAEVTLSEGATVAEVCRRTGVTEVTYFRWRREYGGMRVNLKRVHRIWRREGLKVPSKQPKRGRLWLNDGSCIRLRPTHKGHVWAYDFVHDRTRDGRVLKMLVVVDEFNRECLAIETARKLKSQGVLALLTDLFVRHGAPEHIRSGNGPELVARAVRGWLGRVGVRALFIEPGSPWENGYCESFNGKFRDELLNTEIFYSLRKAQILIERWRRHYNTIRPHSALGWRPPAPAAIATTPVETFAIDGLQPRPASAQGRSVTPRRMALADLAFE